MSRKKIDLVGQVFGKLTILEKSISRSKYGAVYWLCQCECGKTRLAIAGNLLAGTATSCGCESYNTRKLHGMTKTRTFKSWDSMKQRCLNVNGIDYEEYGGRGIRICEQWVHSFNNFFADMGDRPANKSLDRIDVNGGYELGNCRWATRSEQQRNKRNSVLIEWKGCTKNVADWSDILQLSSKIICERIKAGWHIDDVLTKPSRKSINKLQAC